MQLSDVLIKRFQDLYRKFYGEEITEEEARKQGLAVMRLISAKEILTKGKCNEEPKHTPRDVYSRIAANTISDN